MVKLICGLTVAVPNAFNVNEALAVLSQFPVLDR